MPEKIHLKSLQNGLEAWTTELTEASWEGLCFVIYS